MNVEVEGKCPVSGEWKRTAKFETAVEAGLAARALSKALSGSYRTSDYRWPEEGIDVTVYTNGEIAAWEMTA